MADRRVPMSQSGRVPLGDATDRVINASPRKPGKRGRAQDLEPNPLRAHPINPNYNHTRAPSAPSMTGSRSNIKAARLDPSSTSNSRPASIPRTSMLSQDDDYGDRRISQISTSSGASSSKRKTHIGPWQLGKTLGKGSCARVRLARHAATQELVAVKILSKNMTHMTQAGSLAELDKWDRKREEFSSENQMPLSIEREVALLKLIDHPNIVKLYDIWENRSEIYLVLEYIEYGDFFAYINQRGPLPEHEVVYYFRQILSGLQYVHSFNICHRDLKPENILMSTDGQVKIADFGMAAIQQSPNHSLRTSCGSPHYAAPELVSKSRYRGDKVDIWSLGCILYASLCGALPFDDPYGDMTRLLNKAARGIYEVPDFVGDEARDLIDKMLRVDASKRIPIKKIWQHPLIKMYDDFDDLNDGGKSLALRDKYRCEAVAPEDLDMQTLRQLKSIWHTFSEKHLAMKLVSPEANDQKLFYALLCNYREKRLENYNTDLTYSPSDYHHLRPANWKKKFTTVHFPSKYGRSASRFTVISKVASDADSEAVETTTDGGGTVRSYDPYKSSRIMDDAAASHAKIIIHRNGSSAKASTRASTLRGVRSGSIKSTSTSSRQMHGTRHITAPAALRSSRRSLSSIKSGESATYTRPASRHKRGVDFSRIRKGRHRETGCRGPASIAGDDTTYERDCMSPTSPVKQGRLSKNSGRRDRYGTQSMAPIAPAKQDRLLLNEELRRFSHSIAKDCDDAFNSTLLSSQSRMSDTHFEPSISEDARTLSIAMTTPTPTNQGAKEPKYDPKPWDVRPLPPAPPPTDSVLHEIMMAKKRAEKRKSKSDESSRHIEQMVSHLNRLAPLEKPSEGVGADRRVVSAPIYSQYSTQWGKDKIPLPSINEKSREDDRRGDKDKARIVSAPVESTKDLHTASDDHRGLEYLARQENTIRVVTSPSDQTGPVKVPAPLNIRKKLPPRISAFPQIRQEPNLRQRYMSAEMKEPIVEEPSTPSQVSSSVAVKKKASWFKRSSRDRDDIFNSKGGSSLGHTDSLAYTDTNSSADPGAIPAKKKSFNFPFWRGKKNEPQMKLSLGGPDLEDSPSPEPVRMFSHPARPPLNKKLTDEAASRNIEPQQNWLARLFRVKPATRYICFSIARRTARQEIAILLREWRMYGIRDVQVDKERNIVFARVRKRNFLNMKEVSFAAEIMTVIEHGRRSQLCIVRFTQERGAASSFHKVVDTMESTFGPRNLLVVDKRKIKMMIKTLNS